MIPDWKQTSICLYVCNRQFVTWTRVLVNALLEFTVPHSAKLKWCTVCCVYREGEVTLVATDLLYPWHGARTGLASSARRWTNQAPESPPSHSWSLYCDYAVTLTVKGRKATFCSLYHTVNLTDSRLEVMLPIYMIHLETWNLSSTIWKFRRTSQKTALSVTKSNRLMLLRDILNILTITPNL
jgi:hypothetical protein